MDSPNQMHKTHQEAIPYLGGLSIVIPLILIVTIGPIFFTESFDYELRSILFIGPAILMSIVGLYDDVKSASAQSRFMIQTSVAILASIYLNQLGYSVSITSHNLLNFFISIFWLVGITNALNFFDNLDGGAAGVSFIAAITLFLLALKGEQFLIAFFSVALSGSILGFLFWNKNPAKIYLGDSGALFIGLLLGLALLQFEPAVENMIASALIPPLILAMPIIDTTVVVISRLHRGVSIFKGGRDHLSHRLIFRGFSRKESALLLWILSLFFGVLGLLVNFMPTSLEIASSLFGLFMMALLTIWFLTMNFDN
jgi:UDP-GlcNAc:undecaprenyl-phosphate GlcNAc-1-phosphate transferase